MTRSRIGAVAAAVAAAAAGVVVAISPASAATTVVTGFTAPSPFFLDNVRGSGTATIGTTYGARTGYGQGAVELSTPYESDKVQVKSLQAAGVPLSTLATQIGYATYRSSTSTATSLQVPSINVEADMNGAADGGYTTLVYEPYYTVGTAGILQDVWQTWDAAQGRWWTTRATAPFTGTGGADTRLWSDVLAANPDAVVLSYAINQGSGNAGLFAAADAFVAGGVTVDFEPRVLTKDDCRDGGWATNFPAGTHTNQGDCVSSFTTGR